MWDSVVVCIGAVLMMSVYLCVQGYVLQIVHKRVFFRLYDYARTVKNTKCGELFAAAIKLPVAFFFFFPSMQTVPLEPGGCSVAAVFDSCGGHVLLSNTLLSSELVCIDCCL